MEVYVVRPPKPRYALHAMLFLATIFTTLVVGARMEFNFLHNLPVFSLNDDALPLFPVRWALAQPSRLLLGIPFASTLMLILLAHEMGHYLCRLSGFARPSARARHYSILALQVRLLDLLLRWRCWPLRCRIPR